MNINQPLKKVPKHNLIRTFLALRPSILQGSVLPLGNQLLNKDEKGEINEVKEY